MDDDGGIMEKQSKYGGKERGYGQVPRNTRIELAYNLTGTTMGLLGECNALIAKILEGGEVSGYKVSDYLDNVGKLTSVIRGMIYAETFNTDEVPF
jgi:hypothetical protein